MKDGETFDEWIERVDPGFRGWRAERERIEAHMPDCYGAPRSCQSCGCDRQGRFSADGVSRPCVSHAYIVAWAKHPISEGRLRAAGRRMI